MRPSFPPYSETWIDQDEWAALLHESRDLQLRAARLKRSGRSDAHVWDKLMPINLTLRSPFLKVRGIDDRER